MLQILIKLDLDCKDLRVSRRTAPPHPLLGVFETLLSENAMSLEYESGCYRFLKCQLKEILALSNTYWGAKHQLQSRNRRIAYGS